MQTYSCLNTTSQYQGATISHPIEIKITQLFQKQGVITQLAKTLYCFLLKDYIIFSEQNLSISWHDSAWIPVLNPSNVLDYFSERSNPFYERQCNNEIIKMQRLSIDQLE